MIFYLLLFHSVIIDCSKMYTTNLILQFFNNYDVKFGLFFLCWTQTEKTKLQKNLQSNRTTRTLFLPIEENTISNLNIKIYNQLAFVLDLDCDNAIKILQEESTYPKFKNSYYWLIFYTEKQDLTKTFVNINLRLDTKMEIVDLDSDQIFEAYKPGFDNGIKIKLIGLYQKEKVSYFNPNITFYESRKNMEKVLLRTGNSQIFSFNTEEEIANYMRPKGGKSEFEKFNIQLFLSLIIIHKFNYTTTTCGVYFGNTSSGIDAGIAKLLYEKQLDISTSGGLLRIGRIDYLDFLVPVYKFRTIFVFRNPGITKPGIEVLRPFSSVTWYVFILTCILIITSIYITFWIEDKITINSNNHNLIAAVLIIISIITQQGSDIVPLRLAGRILFLYLLILSMIVYNYYTSGLVSSLLSATPQVLSTIKELYESDLKIAIENRPYTTTYFIQNTDDYYINMLNKTKIYENGKANLLKPKEGIDRVKLGNFAYHTDDVTAFSWLADAEQDVLCNLAEINLIPVGVVGQVLQKNSEYTELFTISLRKMQTSGIYRREMDYWVSKKPTCLISYRVKAIGINELFLAYIILVCGILLSIIFLFLEITAQRFQ